MIDKLTLRQARNLRGLSLSEVSKQLKVSRKTVENWEKGKTYPHAKSFIELCKLYGVQLSDIFLG